MNIPQKIYEIDWILFSLISILAIFGFSVLYSITEGNLKPWAMRQMIRFVLACLAMISVAIIDIRIWYKYTWLFFIVSVILLLIVPLKGFASMGAQRWIDLVFFKLQPSEVMKIAAILTISRFYSSKTLQTISHFKNWAMLVCILFIPTLLIYGQPDLGTTLLLILGGISIAFLAGVSWKWFALGCGAVVVSTPFLWSVLLPYQRARVLSFFDPQIDPLGAGYHIIQSTLAIESGGMTGTGFMHLLDRTLHLLPAKQTDFIFTIISEEFGFAGGIGVLVLILFISLRILWISLRCKNKFGKLVGMGMGANFFLSIMINVGMVMGIFPVVGVPFPLLSYGGTNMFTTMISFGFIQNVWIHRNIKHPHVHLD